ncbi:pyocin knob domain-containing protein [Pasteurella multocida]|uniref:pyocin knob domain-containing protein n=1 Tax=Pasteurella multocida TaxID=747 RepID=UPI00397C08D9
MADFNKPTVDSHYTQFPNEIRAAICAALSFLDGGSHTNIPMKAKRWNTTSKIFEEYNGSQWVPMSTEYKLPVDYNVLLNKPVPSSKTDSNSETTFASSKAVKTAYDLANGKQSPETTLSGYGIKDFVVKDLTTEDLNKVITPGFYSQKLTTRAENNKNYPVKEAGSLVVKPSAYTLMQEYTTYSTNRLYVRNRTDYAGKWGDWKQLDASVLAQEVQTINGKTQQIEASFNQYKSKTNLKIQEIESGISALSAVPESRVIWTGNVTQNNSTIIQLSESIIGKTLTFYLKRSSSQTLNDNNNLHTCSIYVEQKTLLAGSGKKYLHGAMYAGGWANVQFELVSESQIVIYDISSFYLKQITAI